MRRSLSVIKLSALLCIFLEILPAIARICPTCGKEMDEATFGKYTEHPQCKQYKEKVQNALLESHLKVTELDLLWHCLKKMAPVLGYRLNIDSAIPEFFPLPLIDTWEGLLAMRNRLLAPDGLEFQTLVRSMETYYLVYHQVWDIIKSTLWDKTNLIFWLDTIHQLSPNIQYSLEKYEVDASAWDQLLAAVEPCISNYTKTYCLLSVLKRYVEHELGHDSLIFPKFEIFVESQPSSSYAKYNSKEELSPDAQDEIFALMLRCLPTIGHVQRFLTATINRDKGKEAAEGNRIFIIIADFDRAKFAPTD